MSTGVGPGLSGQRGSLGRTMTVVAIMVWWLKLSRTTDSNSGFAGTKGAADILRLASG